MRAASLRSDQPRGEGTKVGALHADWLEGHALAGRGGADAEPWLVSRSSRERVKDLRCVACWEAAAAAVAAGAVAAV